MAAPFGMVAGGGGLDIASGAWWGVRLADPDGEVMVAEIPCSRKYTAGVIAFSWSCNAHQGSQKTTRPGA